MIDQLPPIPSLIFAAFLCVVFAIQTKRAKR